MSHLGFHVAGLRSLGTRVTDRRGYVIDDAADSVAGPAFRAWAEIAHCGTPVARSGLMGPRFTDSLSARPYALDWGIQRINQQCPIPRAIVPDSAECPVQSFGERKLQAPHL